MFVCIVSEISLFVRYPSDIAWNILQSPWERLQLASAGVLFSSRKQNPFSKELSDYRAPSPLPSSSSWPLIPASGVLIDFFERCTWSFSQKTGWIVSLVCVGSFTAFAWVWDEGLQKKFESEMWWPCLYLWTMPRELIHCTPVWRAAATPSEAGVWTDTWEQEMGRRLQWHPPHPQTPSSAPQELGAGALVWWREGGHFR